MNKYKLIVSVALLVASSASWALESFIGRVTFLEPSYIPGMVVFSMDAGNSTCPVGALLKWNNSDIENKKVVYATLMTALVSGKNVKFIFNDGDTSCFGNHIHLLAE